MWNLEENEFFLDGAPVKDDWVIPFAPDFAGPMKSSEWVDSMEANQEVSFDFLNAAMMDFLNQEMVLRFHEGKVFFSTDLGKLRRSCNPAKVKLVEQLLKKKVRSGVGLLCSRSMRRVSSEWMRIFVS